MLWYMEEAHLSDLHWPLGTSVCVIFFFIMAQLSPSKCSRHGRQMHFFSAHLRILTYSQHYNYVMSTEEVHLSAIKDKWLPKYMSFNSISYLCLTYTGVFAFVSMTFRRGKSLSYHCSFVINRVGPALSGCLKECGVAAFAGVGRCYNMPLLWDSILLPLHCKLFSKFKQMPWDSSIVTKLQILVSG